MKPNSHLFSLQSFSRDKLTYLLEAQWVGTVITGLEAYQNMFDLYPYTKMFVQVRESYLVSRYIGVTKV